MVDERWRLVDQQFVGLFLVVLDSWDSMMTTGEHLSWIPMDELLVESLGLTKACDTSQSYSQLQMFLLACPDTFIIDNNMRRDRLWLGHGEVWIGTSSTEIPIQIQFLDSRSNGHRYFSWRTQERRVQDVCRGQTVMVRVVQCQHKDLRQRLAWDPGIAGLSSSLTDRGEWTMAKLL